MLELPLSESQRAIIEWRREIILQNRGFPSVNLPALVYECSGAVDLRKLESAFAGLVDHHPSLRAVYVLSRSPYQQVPRYGRGRIQVSSFDGDADAARAWIDAEQSTPFPLGDGIRCRLLVACINREQWLISLVVDHCASDPRGLTVMVQEIASRYNSDEPRRVTAAQRANAVGGYSALCTWDEEPGYADLSIEAAAYWKETLAGKLLPSCRLPFLAQPSSLTSALRLSQRTIPDDAAQAIRHLARLGSCSAFFVLLSLLQVAVWRYSGNPTPVVTPIVRRDGHSWNLVGDFHNIVIRPPIVHTGDNLLDIVRRTGAQVRAARKYDSVFYGTWLSKCSPGEATEVTSHAEPWLILNQTTSAPELALNGLTARAIDVEERYGPPDNIGFYLSSTTDWSLALSSSVPVELAAVPVEQAVIDELISLARRSAREGPCLPV